MAIQQRFGIKYPFLNRMEEGYFVDVNTNRTDKVRSEVMHVILTPKGERIRKPDFGTDLMKYIFDPNETSNWDNIKSEITEAVSKYVSGCSLDNIEIAKLEDDPHAVYVKVEYSVKEGNKVTRDSIITRI
jgi:phage baseplate assembly protein W